MIFIIHKQIAIRRVLNHKYIIYIFFRKLNQELVFGELIDFLKQYILTNGLY